jgi:hypothetical protein
MDLLCERYTAVMRLPFRYWRLWLAVALFLAGLLVAAWLCLNGPQPNDFHARFLQIQPGMQQTEVWDLLQDIPVMCQGTLSSDLAELWEDEADDSQITVLYAKGTVVRKDYHRRTVSLWERVKRKIRTTLSV